MSVPPNGNPTPATADPMAQLVAALTPVAEPFTRLVSHVELGLRRAFHPAPPAKPAPPVPVYDTDDQEREWVTLPNGRRMLTAEFERALKRLTEPFREDEHELRPQPIGQDKTAFQCRQGTKASADGLYCGGYHARSIHLTYVGHAGITDRLTEVDPFWTAEFPRNPDGSPLLSRDGVLWGKLTVLGITRDGVGDTGRQNNIASGNAQKEVIGDFYRNAAMRFGVGAYLWSKSDAAAKKQAGQWEAEAEQVSSAFWAGATGGPVSPEAAAIRDAAAARLEQDRKDKVAAATEGARAGRGDEPAPAPAKAEWKKLTRKSLPMSEDKWWASWDYFSGFGPAAFREFMDFAMNPAHGAPEGLRDDLQKQLESLEANAAAPAEAGEGQ